MIRKALAFAAALTATLVLSCGTESLDDEGPRQSGWSPVGAPEASAEREKMELWETTGGPHLRGVNVWQARVYPELDGPEFKGPGPVGPPYKQADFDRLAALGANYVNISHPGLFSEEPPFVPDAEIKKNLDGLLKMIAAANMFAVIALRTGPGRSEFSFFVDDRDDPEYRDYLNDSVWEDEAAQDAWVEMWRYTAESYRENPAVVGYDLMVEPNAAAVAFDMYEAEEFYQAHGETLYDWNQLFPRIVAAIREVDASTPVLIGAMGHSAVAWLPYLRPVEDRRVVYTVHQYAPHEYTHQPPPLELAYPGEIDLDSDGEAERFDRDWLDSLLEAVDDFSASHEVPVAVNEFGVVRWEPGAAEFMDDQMGLLEERGMSYALWAWDPSWEPFTQQVNEFNFRFGPEPDNQSEVDSSDLIEVIVGHWARNRARPSNTLFMASGGP